MPPLQSYVHRERLFVGIYAVFAAIILMHFSTLYYRGCCGESVLLDTAGLPAPQVYRVAIPFLLSCIYRLHPVPGSLLYGSCDFVFGLFAIGLFYSLAARHWQALPVSRRAARVGLLLAFLLFPLFFVVPWGRAETLPSACYLGLAILCMERARQGWRWTLLLLAATALQSLLRTDVAVTFGLSVVVLALFSRSLQPYGTRISNLLRGAAMISLTVGIQAYLQFVRFPHRSYMTGSPFMARYNLSPHIFWVPILAVLPVASAAGLLWLRRMRLHAAEALILTSSALFLPLWFSIGIVLEVRIFVPFLMALCTVAARGAEIFLTGVTGPEDA